MNRRWVEVDKDIGSSLRHFGQALALWDEGDLEPESQTGYRNTMAFLHAMQSGHTSLEAAITRVLAILREELPVGLDWHAMLVRRAATALAERPAILPPDLAKAVDRTRSFRHVAMRSYDGFEADLAQPAVNAAKTIVATLSEAMATFRQVIDPEGLQP